MEWTPELVAAIVVINLARVSAKAFQQLSVVHDCKSLVPLGSFAMSATEVLIMAGAGFMAVNGTLLDLAAYAFILGASGAVGSLFAMRLHRTIREAE